MSKELAVITQELAELRSLVAQEKSNRLNDSLFSKELAPHYMQLAAQLAKSEMVPKSYRGKPQDLFVAMAMGYQIGLSVEQSIQAIAVINGKPSLWGDDMLALCMNHPDFVDIIEEPIVSNNNQVLGFRCIVKRKGMSDHIEEFDLNKAKKAGLLGKVGPWTQYPERMMQLRARAFALRNRFPDALKGLRSREEAEDYVDAEYSVVDDSSLSRTELLKKDYLTKTGRIENAETIPTMDSVSDKEIEPENPEREKLLQMENPREEPTSLHSEIRRLLAEKQISEERMIKALKFYEVENIEDLNDDSAQDFINKLNKL